jgi:hypothetical protein
MLQESFKNCSDKWTWRDKWREVVKGKGTNQKGKNYETILPGSCRD